MARFTTAILVSLSLALSACVDMADRDGDDIVPVDPVDPVDPDPQGPNPGTDPAPALVAGGYTLVTVFDLTLDVVLPENAYNTISVLRDFRDDPASTMFQLLEDAGVPVVGDLLDALPESLESRLMGWINDYLDDAVFQEVPVMDVIDDILAIAHTSLTRFDMVSDIDLADPDAEGHAALAHHLRAIDFPLAGQVHRVALPDLGPLTNAESDAWIDREASATAAHLTIGEHQFGLPFGQYAYQAVEAAVEARYGAGIRDTLGAAVNCPALAATVADQCVLGVCVGHEQELTEICEQGLDKVVEELHSRFDAYNFEAMELAAGEADMLDAAGEPTDGIADHLSGGLWQSSIDVGMGLRPIDASFTGTRR